MYRLTLSEQAQADYVFFVKAGQVNVVKKIVALLKELEEHPYTGTGKPEPLKFNLSGCWSRRINSEHRIVYRVSEQRVEVLVLAMRYHYNR